MDVTSAQELMASISNGRLVVICGAGLFYGSAQLGPLREGGRDSSFQKVPGDHW